MKVVPFFISAAVTTGLIIILNVQLPSGKSKTPRLGYFLHPQYGFWQNAEPTDISFNDDIKIKGIKGKADVYFDDRLVPHVFADNNDDAYFIEGYMHAKFRLWQMEFQAYAAGGRLSEILGEQMLNTDKYFRRLGMVYGAEKAVNEMNNNDTTKAMLDAYTAGVNAYIHSLKENQLPFEYKLLNYHPEDWTPLKTALLLKFISYDLSGTDDDLLYTNTKNVLGWGIFSRLFPDRPDSLSPIIPKNTTFKNPSITPQMPDSAASEYFGVNNIFTENLPPLNPDKFNGSNNWAVSGSKTKGGKPILCSDPHLSLNLPSLWYEMQISTPTQNVYGVSFPGAPSIVIGFNDSVAWGVTNAGRDVKDFYEIKFKDSSIQEYWLNNEWKKTEFRKEIIKVRNEPDDIENIAMTMFGPVMYDHHYKNKNKDGKYYAVRWTAHDPSNELLAFYKLNISKNYNDYVAALSTYMCPGQNFAFASVSGDIAIRQQGKFVAKWRHQGDFIMPGTDTSYMWQGYIPFNENPQILNPSRGFISSANQMPADASYPYYLGKASNYAVYRGYIINRKLSSMNNITVDDMMKMQTDNYNVVAEMARPVLLKLLDSVQLNSYEKKYIDILKNWNLRNDANEKGATIFQLLWDSVYYLTYHDEMSQSKLPMDWPEKSTLLDALLSNPDYSFADDITTPNKKETMKDVAVAALHKIIPEIIQADNSGKLEWGKHKDTYIGSLIQLPALGYYHVNTGGGSDCINAVRSNHGPSWRMVVHLTSPIEAYAVYPGGESGNPGSKYYDTFINYWIAGKYYPALFLKEKDIAANSRIKWHIQFSGS